MGKHTLKYGSQEFVFDVDDKNLAAELHSNDVAREQKTAEEHINHALDNPIDSPRLEEILKKGDTVCVVVPDSTRLWQSPNVYVPLVIKRINSCGIPDKDILIVTATGTHREMSKEEHIKIVSEDIYNRIRIIDHKCRDTANMKYVGTTRRGTKVSLNKHAMDCDKLILTGGVVYHFLAGYGGGPKYVLPGIASYETIQQHHNSALNEGFGNGTNPDVRSDNMSDSNVFHTDLEEGASLGKPAFLMNVVVDSNYQIMSAVAGNFITAHRVACKQVDENDGVYVKERTPLVIASAGGYPKDMNFYQTIKTLSNALAVVSDKGTIIVLSHCTEGFGDDDCMAQIKNYSTMEEREKALRADFSIGGYVGFLFSETAEKYNLIVVTSMPAEEFAKTNIHVATSLDQALDIAKNLNNGSLDMKTTLLPHGGTTLPKFK